MRSTNAISARTKSTCGVTRCANAELEVGFWGLFIVLRLGLAIAPAGPAGNGEKITILITHYIHKWINPVFTPPKPR